MEKKAGSGLHPAWEFIAAGFYVTHAVTLIRTGNSPHLLWSCHLACLLLAAGILLRRPTLSGVSLLWLATGLPTWIAAVLSREGFFHASSALTHVFGLVLAAIAVRVGGLPRGTWWKALAGLAALWIVTRLVTPGNSNVNVTRDYFFGWEAELMSFPVYVCVLAVAAGWIFFGIERLARTIRRA